MTLGSVTVVLNVLFVDTDDNGKHCKTLDKIINVPIEESSS